MKYKFVYKTVTALILTIASVQSVLAGPGWVTQQNDDRVEEQYSARSLTLNKKPIISKEDQWWMEYQSSKNNIVQYVHDLSKSNPEAAAWFLLTGGKYGFSNRQATAEEEKVLLGVMKTISSSLDKSQKLIEYCVSEIGKFHLDLMYKQFDQIASIVQNFNLQTIEDEYFSNPKNSTSSFMEDLSREQIEEAFKDANRLGEYSLFSDKLKKGLVAIYSAVQDKYFADVKPIQDKYHSDHKLVQDKYFIDLFKMNKNAGFCTASNEEINLWRKKEAATLDLFRKKEATTLDLFRKKEAIKKEIANAPYFRLIDLVNHYYPNSI